MITLSAKGGIYPPTFEPYGRSVDLANKYLTYLAFTPSIEFVREDITMIQSHLGKKKVDLF